MAFPLLWTAGLLILRLALPSPLRRLFDYLPPPELRAERLQPGMRLRVPFGRRQMVGVLVELATDTDVPPQRLKAALELLDDKPLLPPSLLHLCRFAANYWQHSLGDALATALPLLLRQGEAAQRQPEPFWQVAKNARADDPRLARAPRQRQALQVLAQHPHGVAQRLLARLQLNRESLNLLRAKGLVEVIPRHHPPAPLPVHWLAQPELPLNHEQQAAFAAVQEKMSSFAAFLLDGVTGSGKTEVYLQLIRSTLEAGRQALVLIPEINLGPQTLSRFTRRFNARIALLHSARSDRERLDAWLAAAAGEADIVIGTRSALFTPLPKLGLIVVDEEHDSSYKQQDGLRYQARDLALVRARQDGVPIVLGSATPALESLHNAMHGRYQWLRLTQRAGSAAPPAFVRLDVKSRPLDSGISEPLVKAIGQTLAAGQQVLVFLNRRGFAPVLCCHDCGWLSACPRCDARMTVHQQSGELRCHHCGYVTQRPKQCPDCGKVDLRPLGAGTERAEQRLGILFKDFPVLRIDRDSTSRKGSLEQLLQQVQRGEPCILLGTQMLAKGHHFPRVTLVAIVDADSGLFSADFRAAERMAQQIVQVAGRAGRAEAAGQVIIQTHLAEHPLLVQLCQQGYGAFAQQALQERQSAALPPFSHLALLRAEAGKANLALEFLDEACALAENLQQQLAAEVELLGPIAPMERRAGKYRAQLLLKSNRRTDLHRLLAPLVLQLEAQRSGQRVRWSVDVDPMDLF